MANVKISELTAVSTVESGDLFEVSEDTGGGTFSSKKATAAQIRSGLATSGAITGSGLTMNTARILGRTTASSGVIEELSSVPLTLGGTGASTAADARTALELGSAATMTGPTGDIVGTTDSQTLSAKTLTNPTVTNYVETVYAPSAGTSFTVNLANGTIQKFTSNGNLAITLPSSVAGKSYLIIVAYGGAHTLSFSGGSTIKWAGGSAPTATSVNGKFDIFSFWCDGTNTYAAAVGLNF